MTEYIRFVAEERSYKGRPHLEAGSKRAYIDGNRSSGLYSRKYGTYIYFKNYFTSYFCAFFAIASSRWILLQAIAAGISPNISLLRPMKVIPPGLHIPPESA